LLIGVLFPQNLKQQKSRQDHFSLGPVSSSLPPSAISGHHQGSVLLAEEVSVNMEAHSPLLPVAQKQAMVYDETVRKCLNHIVMSILKEKYRKQILNLIG
jgi:hypothetical protein